MTEHFAPARTMADILERLAHRDRLAVAPHEVAEGGCEIDGEREFHESVVSVAERIARSIAKRSGVEAFGVPFRMRTDKRSMKVWKQACQAIRLIIDVDVDRIVFKLRIEDAAARVLLRRTTAATIEEISGEVSRDEAAEKV